MLWRAHSAPIPFGPYFAHSRPKSILRENLSRWNNICIHSYKHVQFVMELSSAAIIQGFWALV